MYNIFFISPGACQNQPFELHCICTEKGQVYWSAMCSLSKDFRMDKFPCGLCTRELDSYKAKIDGPEPCICHPTHSSYLMHHMKHGLKTNPSKEDRRDSDGEDDHDHSGCSARDMSYHNCLDSKRLIVFQDCLVRHIKVQSVVSGVFRGVATSFITYNICATTLKEWAAFYRWRGSK